MSRLPSWPPTHYAAEDLDLASEFLNSVIRGVHY